MTLFTFLVEAEVWLRIFDLLIVYETELSFNDGTNYWTRSRHKNMRSINVTRSKTHLRRIHRATGKKYIFFLKKYSNLTTTSVSLVPFLAEQLLLQRHTAVAEDVLHAVFKIASQNEQSTENLHQTCAKGAVL